MNDLFVGNFRVDSARCLVHRETDTVALEPKVLQVLLCLAKQQGKVVSHQTLLEEVWPNTIVDPSSLQRCIAQLRKAFQDNAKAQGVIATYPKNGYSLISEVRWVDSLNTVPANDKPIIPKRFLPAFTAIAALLLIALISQLGLFGETSPSPDNSHSDDLTLNAINDETELSGSNQSDFYAVYSPDGHYVVYPRFVEDHLSHLWAQNLSSGEEFQLTQTAGYYEYAAWSPDSQYIAFVESACGDESCQVITCSALNILPLPGDNISADLIQGEARNLIGCRSIQLQSPQWLSTNEIALIERSGQRSTIIKYGIEQTSREVLYQQPGKTPYHLTYSENAQKLAITLSNENSQQELLLLAMDTGAFTHIPIALPDTDKTEPWHTSWNPQSTGLLVSSLSKVFNISLDGTISEQVYPYLP